MSYKTTIRACAMGLHRSIIWAENGADIGKYTLRRYNKQWVDNGHPSIEFLHQKVILHLLNKRKIAKRVDFTQKRVEVQYSDGFEAFYLDSEGNLKHEKLV